MISQFHIMDFDIHATAYNTVLLCVNCCSSR